MPNKTDPALPKSSFLQTIIRKKWFIWVRDISLIAAVVVGISMWQAKDMLSTDGSISVNQQNLVSLQGDVLPILADNKPNLVYFFAPWCQICSLSIGNLDYLDEEAVNIVIIALDYDSKEEVQAFVKNHKVLKTVLLGNTELKTDYKIQGYPSYYLIDENNKVVSSSFGYSTAVGLKLREVFGK